MHADFTRLVLKEDVPAGKINGLALDQDWQLHDLILSSELQPYEKIWLTPGNGVAVHYIDDPMVDLRYIMVEGDDREDIVDTIVSTGNVYTDKEIREMVSGAKSVKERIKAIQRAGLAAPQKFDRTYFKYITGALSDPDPEVRRAALTTTAYVAWRQLEEPMQRVAESDPDPEIRKFAAFGLKSLEKHNWDERT